LRWARCPPSPSKSSLHDSIPSLQFEAPEKKPKSIFEILKTTCVEPYCPCRAKALATAGQKKHRKIHGFGFSLMSDGCDYLLQLVDVVMFAACADFS
jgi:hypothetical protein